MAPRWQGSGFECLCILLQPAAPEHEDALLQGSRMPRLNRTVVLTVLVISSSVFLLFQLYYYRKYVSKVRTHTHTQSTTGDSYVNNMQKCNHFRQRHPCVLH